MEETYHVTFSKDDEAITKPSTEGDEINFNENISFPDDEFLVPRSKDINSPDESPKFTIADDHLVHNEPANYESINNLEPAKVQDTAINKPISKAKPSSTNISQSVEIFINPPIPQDRWSKEKHINLVNIIEIKPKKLIETIEEEGWIIAVQEELN
ncbi:hypothetical protein Tco_0547708 [Tanacetum coccineum]